MSHITNILATTDCSESSVEVMNYAVKIANKNQAEITYRLAGLYFLVQKDNEGLFFLENSFKIDYEYYQVIKDVFPIVFDRSEVIDLERKFNTSN